MMTMLAGLGALLLALLAVAFLLGAKSSPIASGIAGLIAGFLFGFVLAVVIRASNFFGPVRLPDPIIEVGGVAMGVSLLYPPLLGLVGLTVGCLLGARQRR